MGGCGLCVGGACVDMCVVGGSLFVVRVGTCGRGWGGLFCVVGGWVVAGGLGGGWVLFAQHVGVLVWGGASCVNGSAWGCSDCRQACGRVGGWVSVKVCLLLFELFEDLKAMEDGWFESRSFSDSSPKYRNIDGLVCTDMCV